MTGVAQLLDALSHLLAFPSEIDTQSNVADGLLCLSVFQDMPGDFQRWEFGSSDKAQR